MDYDDNDFQCQNFQPAGEDSNKFPPSLRSIPLPKFDLDEHFHANLRFDSLVETEVLLGIQGQGNNWIEDFTHVGGEIEFSSSAAESCVISRHKNVWSEATSSESVEMLLKSVGEDEMLDQKAIIEADADNVLNHMDGQMDTCLSQNDLRNPETGDIIHNDPLLPPDKCEKSLSLLNVDAIRDQHQVEGMPEPSKNEKSGTDIDVSSLSEKFISVQRIVANQCNIDKKTISATKSSSENDDSISEAVQNDNPLRSASVNKCATNDHIANAGAGENYDFIAFSNVQGDPSSVSTGDLVLGPGKMNTEMSSEPVMGEYSKIDISGKSGLLADDAQKESNQIRDDRLSQGSAVRSGLSSAEDSSFLEPTMESLALLNEGCNVPDFSVNSDGLLGAITRQVKALSKGQTFDKIVLPTTEKSLVMEGDRIIEKNPVDISTEDTTDLSNVTEGFKNDVHISKDNATHVDSTMSTESTNMVDGYAGQLNSLGDMMEEKRNPEIQLTDNSNTDGGSNPEVQLTDNSNTDGGSTSKFTVEVHSLYNMSSEMVGKETKDANDLGFNEMTGKETNDANDLGVNPLNLTSQDSIVNANYYDAVVEDVVKEPDVKSNAPKNGIFEESVSSALPDGGEKVSFFICSKSVDKCDTDGLVAEAHDVHAFTPEVTTSMKVNPAETSNSCRGNSNDDASIVKEKMEDVSSAGRETALLIVTDSSANKLTQDDSVTALATVDVNLHFLNDSANVHRRQAEDTLPIDAVVKQKEATSYPLPALDFVQPDDKEAVSSGSTISKSSLVKISGESIELSESSVKHMTQDEPALRLVSTDNSKNGHQREFIEPMVVDVYVEQKEEDMSDSHVLDFIHFNEKEMKTTRASNLSVLKGISNIQISSGQAVPSVSANDTSLVSPMEVQPIIVGQTSSSAEGSDVVCQNELQSSLDNPVTRENAAVLEGNLVAPALSVKENINSDPQEKDMILISSVKTANHDERQAMLVPIPLKKSSAGDIQNKQQISDPSVDSRDKCHRENGQMQAEGDALNCCTNSSSESAILTRSNIQSHKLESESANPSSAEQNCGSPTVISSSEHSQEEMDREGNRRLPDPIDTVSDDMPIVSPEMGVNGDKVKSCAPYSKESTLSEADESFTFEVGSRAELSERGTGNEWKPFCNMQSSQLAQSNMKMSKENSEEYHLESSRELHGCQLVSLRELHGTITNTPDEDNTRQVLGFSAAERTATSQEVAKETPNSNQSAERDGKPCSTSPNSVGTVIRNDQFEQMQQYPYNESNIRAPCSPTVQTSNLPDLNTSISAAALFHQPFTDLQQVQLRAQIFVYGSLIQGTPPDEACMISAFGESDGGRSSWEAVWRVSAERCQNQKSSFSSSTDFEGARVSESVTRCNSIQSKTPGTSCRSGLKVISSVIANSTMPLPSPLWSASSGDGLHSNMLRLPHLDFNQALSPLNSHQSSQIRQYTGNCAPWLSQSPRPGTWVVSSQDPTFDATAQYSGLPVAETVQVTSVRDSSIPCSLNMQFVSPTALLTTPGPTSVSAVSVVQVESKRKTTTPEKNKGSSTVQKYKKRKKHISAHEENILASHPLAEPASAKGVNKHSLASTSAGLPEYANSPAKLASGGLVSATSHIISPTHYQIISRGGTEQRAIFSEETCSKIEQAKLQAEDAAVFAASAVRHSQSIWSQLANQKNSGLVSAVDEKLASAAVSAAAAASVAKAAAAAAKVASDAALQAKMMADEALDSAKTRNLGQISETGHLDVGKSLARLTPTSILKGKDKVHNSTSVISAARGAARKRLEAASAATKRVENLDAIVRAAELAAEAVSQAGNIIAMGEPLPFTLSDLVEAGPEGHWKVHLTADKLAITSSLHQQEHTSLDVAENPDNFVEEFNEHPSNNKVTDEDGMVLCNEHPMQSEEHCKGNGSGAASSTVPIDGHEKDHSACNQKKNSIQKGSLVEVIVDEDGLRGVWFSACVHDVKDGKAYVCYNNLVPDEGNGPLKEWISLEGEGNKAPRIRLAHSMTAAKYEGTRKRRREAIDNYVWAVGDRVDVWIRDGWWEGIVTEKSQEDDTKLTVHFPDGGDSSIVRTWNVRPSLLWKDGHWIEWPRAIENAPLLNEGDMPQEKRQKLGRHETRKDSEVDGKGLSKLSKNLPVEDLRKTEESRALILSTMDKIFSVGKNAGEENNSDVLKVRRTGLQKEGSRVVFGVPKPGKKRKFMEVSKHYVADKKDKVSEGNDSMKFAKYLMPRTSRIWKNTSKVDLKGKTARESKPPKGLKSMKSQGIQTRSTAEKDNSSITASSNGGETAQGSLPNVRAALSSEQNNLEKSRLEVGSYANNAGAAGNPQIEPSVQPVTGVPSSKRKTSSAVEADPGVKGKLTPALGKSTTGGEGHENTGKMMSGVPEPRRSSRRIQPTSRLLEGLQSSLIISKIPSFSQDKGIKSQHRGASSRGNAHG